MLTQGRCVSHCFSYYNKSKCRSSIKVIRICTYSVQKSANVAKQSSELFCNERPSRPKGEALGGRFATISSNANLRTLLTFIFIIVYSYWVIGLLFSELTSEEETPIFMLLAIIWKYFDEKYIIKMTVCTNFEIIIYQTGARGNDFIIKLLSRVRL